MEHAEFEALLTPEALRLLDDLPEYDTTDDVLAMVSSLRKQGHSPALSAAVLTQARLRKRARAKFGEFASRMLFTDEGLEQATRLSVAAHHAERFRSAGCATVIDLGCGLGADAMALASLGLRVVAIEKDPITAALASFNLGAFENAEVRQADATTVDLGGFDGVYVDPARRAHSKSGSQRSWNPEDFSPSFDFSLSAARQVGAGGIKLGPGFDRANIPDDAEAQWVAVGDDVVEMGLWFGAAKRSEVTRAALVIRTDGPHEMVATFDAPDEPVGSLARYIVEPNGAVIRARLVGEVARSLGGHMLAHDIAYITSDAVKDSPFARHFEVLAQSAVDVKAISRMLANHDIGRLEIKKRGMDIDPAVLHKKLRRDGAAEGVLILTRVGSTRRALLTRRVD